MLDRYIRATGAHPPGLATQDASGAVQVGGRFTANRDLIWPVLVLVSRHQYPLHHAMTVR